MWEERKNDNPLVLDMSELEFDPASWTFYIAFGTFEHLFYGELQPSAEMRGLYRA